MNSLISAYYHVLAWFPLKSSLPCNDIIGIDLLTSQFFYTNCNERYPKRLPAESLVFWVEEACILEALKQIKLVSENTPNDLDLEIAKRFIFIILMIKVDPQSESSKGFYSNEIFKIVVINWTKFKSFSNNFFSGQIWWK